MNATRTWLTGVLLGGALVGAQCNDLRAQNWQPNWQPAQSGTSSVDWQQRVLRQAQPQQSGVQQAASWSEQPAAPYKYKVAQRSNLERSSFAGAATPSEPSATGRQSVSSVFGDAEAIPPGEVQFDRVGSEGVFGGAQGNWGGSCGPYDGCAPRCGPPCNECPDEWPLFDGTCGPWLRGLSVFVGADGFKGPLDRGTNGNFGLNEGVNLARPLGDPWGCGYQVGANFVQSDFSGAPLMTIPDINNNVNVVRAAYRRQYFATAGIFQRADGCGFQWGIAYDYLHDVYYQNSNLQQIRSETSYVLDDTYTIGYYGAYGVGTDVDRAASGFKLLPTDMFVLFVQRTFENGGDGRVWIGATGNGDGLLGANIWVPLGHGFALENRINYMIPGSHTADSTQVRESWGLLAQLVWYPGQNARCQQQNPYRAMFNVADNSLFMVDRLAR